MGPLTVAPHIVASLPYDPKRDIAAITMGVVFPNVFVVYSGVPAKTLAEFIALAKQKSGRLTHRRVSAERDISRASYSRSASPASNGCT